MKAVSRKAAPRSAQEKASRARSPLVAEPPEGVKAAKGKSNGRLKASAAENWDQRLGFLMHDVSRLRRTVFDEYVKPLGVTRSQWWVLAHYARHDGMIQSDVANELELGKAALGGLLDRLETSELIERRPDEIDRRAKRVYLTLKGKQLIEQMRVKSNDMSERMLKELSIEERHSLVDMLQRVKRNLLSIKQADDVSADD